MERVGLRMQVSHQLPVDPLQRRTGRVMNGWTERVGMAAWSRFPVTLHLAVY